MSELFAEHKEELDDKWHEAFDALTAQGKSPSGIKATIEYITTEKTQQEIEHEYNVSQVTIRSLQTAVVALGPLEPSDVKTGGGVRSSADYCTHIADMLGWEEGVHYTAHENMQGTNQPNMLKRGWIDLYNTLQKELSE